MNITFYNSHIETISELDALARKHNCRIAIGTENYIRHPDDFEITDMMKQKDENLKLLDDNNITIYSGICLESSIWFELSDWRSREKAKYNLLIYSLSSGYVEFDRDELECLDDEIKDSIYDDYGHDDTIVFDFSNTEIIGFENVEHEVNVYRVGIALREFSYLVCDYLGEPRIERTYSYIGELIKEK